MLPDPYSRSEVDTRFESLRHQVRGDVASLEMKMEQRFGALDAKLENRFGALDAKLENRLGALEGKFEGLRAEVKVWLLVMAIVVTPMVTALVGRVTALAWPVPGPPVAGQQR